MAPPSASDIAVYRSSMVDLRTVLEDDLTVQWRDYNTKDALATQARLRAELPAVLEGYSLAASTVAADFYDLVRLQAGAPGRFTAELADAPSAKQVDALAGWSVGPLFNSQDPRPDLALSKLLGGAQRAVVDTARNTIVNATLRDPARPRWERVGSGQCSFCRMLIDRGPVYRTASSGAFKSHDSCNCVSVQVY